MSLFAFIACSALLFVSAHPTIYPQVERIDLAESSSPPEILSWHVHLVYSLYENDIKEALEIRDAAFEFLRPYLTPGQEECTARFDTGRLCMIRDHDLSEILTEGPFIAGEWSIFVPQNYLGIVWPWMNQNRGRFSALLHPNTGYMYEDHSIWGSWNGEPWPLNLYPEIIGSPGEKIAEFDHKIGDDANPVCVASPGVCGVVHPSSACCGDSFCDCSAKICVCRAVKLGL